MAYVLGVDLGTTWTAAAVARDGAAPEMVALGGRSAAVPTVVAVTPEGWLVAGEAAERRGAADPSRSAREFKRRIGDTVPVLLGGAPYSPESLLASVCRYVVERVTELEGGPPSSIVVTHPANWGTLRREVLEQALAASGSTARLVTEPEAAAVHYAAAERVPDGTVVAVYDLGGGTFDATVLRKGPAGFEVLGAPTGIERLGGLDFDAAVLGHVTALLGRAWSDLDPDDPATRAGVARLREDCVRAKEALSEDPDAVVPVHLPGIATEVRLTRVELEAMVRPAVEQSVDAVASAIAGAGLDPAQVDRILLVGGSSRIPLVSQVLAARFHRPLALDTHPKHAVALGAARLALGAPVTAPAPQPAPAAPAPAAVASPTTTTATPPGRGRVPLLVGLALLVVVAIVAAVLLSRGGDEDGGLAAGVTTSTSAPTTTTEDGASTTTTGQRSGLTAGLAIERFAAMDVRALELTLASCDPEASCVPGSESFIAPIEVFCVGGPSCSMAFDGSDPIDMGDDEDVVVGEGPAADGKGLTCDGFPEPDPTVIDFIFDVGDEPGELSGTVMFSAVGNCPARSRTYEVTPTTPPVALADLEGAWLFEGVADLCTGLDTASCEQFRQRFAADFTVQCSATVETCEVVYGASAPAPLADLDGGDPDVLFTAAGPLADADGFSCGAVPDPTDFILDVSEVHVEGGQVVSFEAQLDLASDVGDGATCDASRVIALGTATRN